MTETRNRGPEPCSALFLEWAAAVGEDNGSTILQLNVKGLTNSKLTIIEQLAHTNKVTAILLQETHCETTEKLTIPEFTLASHILNKQHGLATFVRQDIEWSLETQSEDYSQLEWLAVKVQNVTIINVYFFLFMSDAHHGINSSTQKYQSTQSSVVLTSCRQDSGSPSF